MSYTIMKKNLKSIDLRPIYTMIGGLQRLINGLSQMMVKWSRSLKEVPSQEVTTYSGTFKKRKGDEFDRQGIRGVTK